MPADRPQINNPFLTIGKAVTADSINDLNKTMKTVSHQLGELLRENKTTKPAASVKKDFLRKEDPIRKQTKILTDINTAIIEGNKFQKDQAKKKGLNWMAMLAAIMGIGGLLGFLMTGKTEFLSSMFKGLLKYSPLGLLIKIFDKAIIGLSKPILKGIGKVFGFAFEQLAKIPAIDKAIGKVKGIFKPIVELVSHLGGVFGKLGGGMFGKIAGGIGKKLGAVGLKKIPFIGALIGLFFGINRFKKGDWLGGALEIASGISSIIPGAGTLIGIGIDAFLLFRDFQRAGIPEQQEAPKPKKASPAWLRKIPIIGPIMDVMDAFKWFKAGETGKAFRSILTAGVGLFPPLTPFADKIAYPLYDAFEYLGNAAISFGGEVINAAPEVAKTTIDTLRTMPIIGTFISIFDAMDKFKTDPLGAIKDIASTANLIMPGFGDTLVGAVDWISTLAESEPVKKFMGAAKKGVKAAGSVIASGASAVGSAIASGATAAGSAIGKTLSSGAAAAINYTMSDIREAAPNMPASFKGLDATTGATTSMDGKIPGLRLASGVDISGVEPTVWQNFVGMVGDYFRETGKTVQLNSAFRTKAQQALLFAKDPLHASDPRNPNIHNLGYALDINSNEAGQMESMGLMKKWHFHRPGLKWKYPETWHVESSDINRWALLGKQKSKNEVDAPIKAGDQGGNMPNASMPSRPYSNDSGMKLSNESIELLAAAIGKQFKGSLPTSKTPNITVGSSPVRG